MKTEASTKIVNWLSKTNVMSFLRNTEFSLWYIRGGFLIRRSSAIRRFIAGFLRCDNRTIMKSFLKKIAHKFSGNFGGFLCNFPVNLRAIFLRNDFIIVRLSHLRNPAINLRIAELRLMRNPPQGYITLLKVWHTLGLVRNATMCYSFADS